METPQPLASPATGPRAQPLGVGGPDIPKNWMDHPNFFDEECDYRYVTYCSPRNWVYHRNFVLYNNLEQEIGPSNFENVVAPLYGALGHVPPRLPTVYYRTQ